jgi:hypothetical protein
MDKYKHRGRVQGVFISPSNALYSFHSAPPTKRIPGPIHSIADWQLLRLRKNEKKMKKFEQFQGRMQDFSKERMQG